MYWATSVRGSHTARLELFGFVRRSYASARPYGSTRVKEESMEQHLYSLSNLVRFLRHYNPLCRLYWRHVLEDRKRCPTLG